MPITSITTTIYECDRCGRRVENPTNQPQWQFVYRSRKLLPPAGSSYVEDRPTPLFICPTCDDSLTTWINNPELPPTWLIISTRDSSGERHEIPLAGGIQHISDDDGATTRCGLEYREGDIVVAPGQPYFVIVLACRVCYPDGGTI